MTVETIFIAAVFGIPLVVAALRATSDHVQSTWVVGSLLTGALALLGLAWMGDGTALRLWPWVVAPSADLPTSGIELAVIADSPLALLTAAALVSELLAYLTLPRSSQLAEPEEAGEVGLRRCRDLCVLALQWLICLGALATDFIVVLASWLASDAVIELWRRRVLRQPSDSELPSVLMPLRLVGVVLLVGVGILDGRYSQTGIQELIEAALSDSRLDANQVRSGLAIVLAAALAWRCGQVPGLLWVRRLIGNAPTTSAAVPSSAWQPAYAWICCVAVVVPAAALIVRLQSLWKDQRDAAFLLGALGALTTLMAGLMACVAPSEAETSGRELRWITAIWVLIATLGQALMGTAVGEVGATAAVFSAVVCVLPFLSLFASESLVGTPRKQDASSLQPSMLVVFQCLVIASGFLCQGDTLGRVMQVAVAETNGAVVMGFDRSRAFMALWLVGIIGQCCIGFALMRAVWRASANAKLSSSPLRSDRGFQLRDVVSIAVSLFVFLVVVAGVKTLGILQPSSSFAALIPQFTIGPALPAGLLGCLTAWLASSTFPQLAPFGERIAGPILRLARTGWHLEAAILFGVRVPWTGLSYFAEFFDRRLLGGGKEGAWNAPALRASSFLDEVRAAPSRYYALSIAGAMVGLLVVLSWGGR